MIGHEPPTDGFTSRRKAVKHKDTDVKYEGLGIGVGGGRGRGRPRNSVASSSAIVVAKNPKIKEHMQDPTADRMTDAPRDDPAVCCDDGESLLGNALPCGGRVYTLAELIANQSADSR